MRINEKDLLKLSDSELKRLIGSDIFVLDCERYIILRCKLSSIDIISEFNEYECKKKCTIEYTVDESDEYIYDYNYIAFTCKDEAYKFLIETLTYEYADNIASLLNDFSVHYSKNECNNNNLCISDKIYNLISNDEKINISINIDKQKTSGMI